VFLTFGYRLPWDESDHGRIPLAQCHYGLLAPFLDGMFEAVSDKTLIVDGHETSYSWKKPEQFARARHETRDGLLSIVHDPDRYHRHLSIGFGLWMDYDWRKRGWNFEDPSKNYFTPEALERATRAALDSADKYVWIYTETPRWWSEQNQPVKLPAAYSKALREAHPLTTLNQP
jgi:hypothetical protein